MHIEMIKYGKKADLDYFVPFYEPKSNRDFLSETDALPMHIKCYATNDPKYIALKQPNINIKV